MTDPMSERRPTVTVGVPVLNGERWLRETLDHLSSQTLTDFEVVISDNASTDATPEIVNEFAQRDPRFIATRTGERLSVVSNHNRTLELARGEYFMWNASDDRARPRHLEACTAALDTHPEVIAAFSRMAHIDESGELLANFEDANLDCTGLTPDQRVALLLHHQAFQLVLCGGVMRTADLRRLGGLPPGWGGDFVLGVMVAIRAPWIQVPEVLYEERFHTNKLSDTFRTDLGEQLRNFDPGHKGIVAFPEWTSIRRMIAASLGAPAPRSVRLRAAVAVVTEHAIPGRDRLMFDLKRNAIFLARRLRRRLGELLSADRITPSGR